MQKKHIIATLSVAAVLIAGTLGVAVSQNQNKVNTYDSQATTYSHVEKTFKNLEDGDSATVVFHKEGCHKCESVQTQSMKLINQAEKNGQLVDVVAVDTLSKSDIQDIQKQFPSMVFNNHVRVPVALKVQNVHGKLIAVQQADLTDENARQNIFERTDK